MIGQTTCHSRSCPRQRRPERTQPAPIDGRQTIAEGDRRARRPRTDPLRRLGKERPLHRFLISRSRHAAPCRPAERTSPANGDPRTSPVTAPAGVSLADHDGDCRSCIAPPASCLTVGAFCAGVVAGGAGRPARSPGARVDWPCVARRSGCSSCSAARWSPGLPPAQRHPPPGVGRGLRLRHSDVLRSGWISVFAACVLTVTAGCGCCRTGGGHEP